MKTTPLLCCVAVCCVGTCGLAQHATLPDNPLPAHSVAVHDNLPPSRVATWRSFPGDVLKDQKAIWTFPVTQLGHGKDWLPTLAVIGGTAGLIAADSHIMPHLAARQRNLDDVNDVFDSSIAAGAIAAVPVSLLAAGALRHDDYQTGTGLLAGEAYADSAIVAVAIKVITRRRRPADVPPGAPFTDTFFNSKRSPISGSSFPSGHATAAFAIATVVAHRYANHRWVPWAAYGMATAISFSRVSTMAHFPSDVFLGGALGYTIARYQTMQPQ